MTTLREAAQQALEALAAIDKDFKSHGRQHWPEAVKARAAIAALRAALAEPPVDDPHRDHWVAIAEAAQKIAASTECGLAEAKALCAALDRLTDAALAEPVQEPFCYVYEYDSPYGLHREFYPREYNGMKPSRTVPLYAAPPQRKPLSEDEALDIARTFGAQPWPPGSCVAFARAIERAHGIGGQP